ncbi:MAG: class I SAM-dependent methyltransferase [Endomicrobiales bacterium]|nr:class I SAM-dependent methyltransferase [Endomicrobiales bacterium]
MISIKKWRKLKSSTLFKLKRLKIVDKMCNGILFNKQAKKKKVIEIGCANGIDFLQFFKDKSYLDLYGIDLKDRGFKQDNFTMIVGDAEKIPFSDNYFDLAISIGVLEHIQPIEKLCLVIKEINRVAKSYIHIVPAINTLFEPHTL